MMNFIRTKLKFLMWVIAIAFVAGLFFIGGRSIGFGALVNILPASFLVKMPGCARSAGIIMKIGNYGVGIEEYKRIKENTIENARTRYKDRFNTYAQRVNFDELTQENITRYALLIQEAEKYNIYISGGELREGIRDFPYWVPEEIESRIKLYPYYTMAKMRGDFNSSVFNNLLENYGKITPEDFSKEVENGLRIARLKDMLNGSTMITDMEIRQEYLEENEKAKIDFLEFKYTDFADKVSVDDAELNQYFQENILNYRTKDKVNISFVKIDPKSFESGIMINDSEILSYYNAHKEEDYFEPEKVKARHIFVRTDAEASPEDKAKAKAYAEKMLADARKPGVDFDVLAAKYNNETFEVKHEDLGSFERGKMVKPFEDAAFALSPGQVSNIVETRFGYHIIRVEGRSPAKTKSLEEVKDEIVRKLTADQSLVEARQKADDIQYDIMSEEDIQAAVDNNPNLKLKIEETGFFAKGDFIPKIGSGYVYSDVAEEAFKLKIGEISDLVEVKSYDDSIQGYFIFKLIGQKAGGIPTLAEVKDNVTKDLKTEKAKKLAMEEAAKIKAANAASDLAKIAEKNKLTIGKSEYFSLSSRGYIGGKPSSIDSKTIMMKAFTMNVGEIAGPFETDRGAYLIQLVEYNKIDDKTFAEDQKGRNEIRSEIVKRRQQEIYNSWYQKVKSEATIESFIPVAS